MVQITFVDIMCLFITLGALSGWVSLFEYANLFLWIPVFSTMTLLLLTQLYILSEKRETYFY